MTANPNVLFVICDDLNNAIAGMGRQPCAPAPNVRRLLQSGVRFTNAHNNCPLCLPSRNSLFSGIYPYATGHYTLWDHWPTQQPIQPPHRGMSRWDTQPLLGDAVTMPRHFLNHGYRCFGAGKVFHNGNGKPDSWTDFAYGPDYGPALWDTEQNCPTPYKGHLHLLEGEPLASYRRRYNGLDRFFLNEKGFATHISMAFGPMPEVFSGDAELRAAGEPYHYVSDDDRDLLHDEKTADWVVDVLQQQHDEPFFVAAGFMKPHTPLNVPQRFFDMFPPDELKLPPLLENDCDDCARALVEHRPYGFLTYGMVMKGGEEMWRKWLQAYLACVAFMDEQLGKILDALEASPYADNTIIVFTSDNGYHMGEKEYLYKDSLREESGGIPLVIHAPGATAPGGICSKPVSLIDVYPTLIDLCGLPGNPHGATHGHPLQGHSLRPLLQDPNGSWSGPDVALTSVRGDTGIHHSVRSERYRYTVCNNGEEELYDHETDPHEWHNQAANSDFDTIRQKLRMQLFDMLHAGRG